MNARSSAAEAHRPERAGVRADITDQFAAYLAESFGCSDVVELAAGRVEASSTSAHRSLVVCRDPRALEQLADVIGAAPAGIVLYPPDREMAGPRALADTLMNFGVAVPFAGWTPRIASDPAGRQLLAVVEAVDAVPANAPPPAFRVVAFVPTFNEADIIAHTLQYLTAQGIDVYVIDNWSTDDTIDRVEAFVGRGVVGIERFPAEGPPATYEWRRILGRIEELAQHTDADWLLLHDADERRYSSWEGMGLREGLYRVERAGFTCVDHIVLNFWPTRDGFDPARDVEDQLTDFEFSDHAGHFHQRKAWKKGAYVSIAPSAGHDVVFPGRLVYPFKFLMKHYPIRSEAHGRRKVLHERAPRFAPQERALGWHRQYDELARAPTFIRDPATLRRYDEAAFREDYLVERLSGIGVFNQAPPWATAPRQRF